MREKFLKKKGFRALAVIFMSVLLLLGVVQAAAASENSGSGRTTGSLSLTLAVTENGKQVPLTNVPLALYQVADMDTEPVSYFHMASSLSGTGVDLNNLKTAADAESASKILANAVGAAGIVPLTGTTDGNGNLSFTSLPKGVYLLVQTGGLDYCRVSPMLVSVPYTSDGLTFEYDVQAFPKAEKTKEEEKKDRLATVLYNLVEGICIGATLLKSFMPETTERILAQLNAQDRELEDLKTFGLYPSGSKVTEKPEILFARLDLKEVMAKVAELHEDYIRPQENGSHFDCDYVQAEGARYGLTAVSDDTFSFQASEYTQEELERCAHNYELEKSGSTVLCIDYAQNGIGSNSCGPEVLEKYQFNNVLFRFRFTLVPFISV